jgi:hypothetical protein
MTTKLYNNFDLSQRIDGQWNVWAYMMWPDDDLDLEPGAREAYMEGAEGWCARGWVLVHVATSFQNAKHFAFTH